jgi:hypothetical protein
VLSFIFAIFLEMGLILHYRWQARAHGGEVGCPEWLYKKGTSREQKSQLQLGVCFFSAPSELFFLYLGIAF